MTAARKYRVYARCRLPSSYSAFPLRMDRCIDCRYLFIRFQSRSCREHNKNRESFSWVVLIVHGYNHHDSRVNELVSKCSRMYVHCSLTSSGLCIYLILMVIVKGSDDCVNPQSLTCVKTSALDLALEFIQVHAMNDNCHTISIHGSLTSRRWRGLKD